MLVYIFLIVLANILPYVNLNGIENRIEGIPHVSCEMRKITIRISTRKLFVGRIFINGMSKRNECMRQYKYEDNVTSVEFEMNFNDCGMIRERKLSPSPGLMESLVVIVSFHALFITKADRAFSIKCFYSQAKLATVQNIVNVSAIDAEPLAIIEGQAVDCNYDVRMNDITGSLVDIVQVGDKLSHVWTCDGPDDLRILVKNCRVFDGDFDEFMMIDNRGCSIDPAIMPDLSYLNSAKMAHVQVDAFKFADTNFLGFHCTVQLCSETNGDQECQSFSPPVCNAQLLEEKIVTIRHIRDVLPSSFVDVSTPSLIIIDSNQTRNRPQFLSGGWSTSPDNFSNAGSPDGSTLEKSMPAFLVFTTVGTMLILSIVIVCVVQHYQLIKC